MTREGSIAANIARLRLDRQLTQEELAAKAGLSRVALGKIERGTVVPRARTLAVLATALAVPVGDLVTPVDLSRVCDSEQGRGYMHENRFCGSVEMAGRLRWPGDRSGRSPSFPLQQRACFTSALGSRRSRSDRSQCGWPRTGGASARYLRPPRGKRSEAPPLGDGARLLLRVERRGPRWRPRRGRQHVGSDFRGAMDLHRGPRARSSVASSLGVPARCHRAPRTRGTRGRCVRQRVPDAGSRIRVRVGTRRADTRSWFACSRSSESSA